MFRLGFYVPITTSPVVLGLLQWLPAVASRGPRLHRWLGHGYAGSFGGWPRRRASCWRDLPVERLFLH